MVMWQLLLIIGLAFLVFEMLTPVMFFLNFAIAAFITAVISIFVQDFNIIMISFVLLSLVLLGFVRPLFVKKNTKDQKTGIENKYIGKNAKVLETVTANSGVISIYDERWEARSIDGEEIPKDSVVTIIKHESLIMGVKPT